MIFGRFLKFPDIFKSPNFFSTVRFNEKEFSLSEFSSKFRFLMLSFENWRFLEIFCPKYIENPYNLFNLKKACILFVSYACIPLCTFVQVIINLCLVYENKTRKINTCTGLVLVLYGTKLNSAVHPFSDDTSSSLH